MSCASIQFLEQASVKATNRLTVDILQRRLMTWLGIAQTRRKMPIMTVANFMLKQECRPFDMAEVSAVLRLLYLKKANGDRSRLKV